MGRRHRVSVPAGNACTPIDCPGGCESELAWGDRATAAARRRTHRPGRYDLPDAHRSRSHARRCRIRGDISPVRPRRQPGDRDVPAGRAGDRPPPRPRAGIGDLRPDPCPACRHGQPGRGERRLRRRPRCLPGLIAAAGREREPARGPVRSAAGLCLLLRVTRRLRRHRGTRALRGATRRRGQRPARGRAVHVARRPAQRRRRGLALRHGPVDRARGVVRRAEKSSPGGQHSPSPGAARSCRRSGCC